MHWKLASTKSPLGVAVKRFSYGFVLREGNGAATFYTYKDFPRNSRSATLTELEGDSGWMPLMEMLPTVSAY